MFMNHIYLLGAFILSLITAPGLLESAHAAGLSSPSSCDLELKLGSADQAACDFKEVTVNGKKVRGRVVVKKAKRVVQPARRWGDPDPAPGAAGVEEEFADIEIQTETECTTGCENGVRQGNPIYESLSVRDARKLNAFVLEKYKSAALELADQDTAKSTGEDQVKQCLVDTNGKEIAENRRLSCRTQMFSTLSDEERESYYDNYIKADLLAAISATNSATRNEAMRMLEKLARGLGPSEYLKEAVTGLHRFGRDLQLVDTLGALPANDTRRFGLSQYLTREPQYFTSRGIQLNSMVFADAQKDVLAQDYIKYQESLTQIISGQQSIGQNTTGTGAPSAPGRNSLGQLTYPGVAGPGTAGPGARVGTTPAGRPVPRGAPAPAPGIPGVPGRMPTYGSPVR